MTSRRERTQESRTAADEQLAETRAQEPGSREAARPIAGGRSLSPADLMSLQRTIGNRQIAAFLEGRTSGTGSRAAIQRQKTPAHYTMKQGGNLRNEAHEVIRYLPEGTPVEVRDPEGRKTKFRAGMVANEHSWSYHAPSGRPFARSDKPAHGWIVDANLELVSAPTEETSEDEAEGSGRGDVTFATQVRLLEGLAQSLVTPPQKLMVHQYRGAAQAWTKHPRALLTSIVQEVDKDGLFAAGIVNKLVSAQASPETAPLLLKMIEDVMGNQMSVLGDSAARMTSTDWVATIRDKLTFLRDFAGYFKDTTEPPAEQKAVTGRQYFLRDEAY